MTVRFAAALLCLASWGAASAQSGTPGERLVQSAFDALRPNTSIWLRQFGTDAIGGRGYTFILDTFWYSNFDAYGQPIGKLECLETRDGIFYSRIVGDGLTLWAFNAQRNEYASTNYGAINSKTQPAGYMQSLMQGFGTHAKGQTIHPARLIREVYSGGMALYRQWLIGANEQVVQGGASFDDPVLGNVRTYASNPAETYVVFWTGGSSPNRSLAFKLVQNSSSGAWELSKIYFADTNKLSSGTRLAEWEMEIYKVQPSVGNFIFVPPNNAKPIVRQGGG
jgi:hypothetical protein